MTIFSLIQQSSFPKRLLCALTAVFFLGTSVFPNPTIAQTIPTVFNLPIPGSVVATTAGFTPAIIKGVNLYPNNPLKFDFIIDKGDTAFTDEEFKKESTKLIKYFLSSLTVPEDEMWVNLSPYGKEPYRSPGFRQDRNGPGSAGAGLYAQTTDCVAHESG